MTHARGLDLFLMADASRTSTHHALSQRLDGLSDAEKVLVTNALHGAKDFFDQVAGYAALVDQLEGFAKQIRAPSARMRKSLAQIDALKGAMAKLDRAFGQMPTEFDYLLNQYRHHTNSPNKEKA